jgi:palmitoyltransferase ZDHHC9/14/18
MGGDLPWAFVASFALLLGIAGCWFASAGVWWWRNVSPAVTIVAAYLTLLTISTMLTTVCLRCSYRFIAF